LDASGGSVFRNLLGAAERALIRAAASTQTLCRISMPMVNAQVFEARITDEGVAALRGMLGLAPQELFSPSLTVDDDFIYSPSFSVPKEGKGWLIIENSWLETPKDYIDYYQIGVSASSKPKDISVGSAEHIGEVLNPPVSSISLGLASPIKRITIHQEVASHSDSVESAVYDRAIIFHRADGLMFSISADDTIADLLGFTKMRDKVQEFIDNCECRMNIE
jgi:hypothetical protein